MQLPPLCVIFFFFNDTATTEIYTLSLHDALPISPFETMNWQCDPETEASPIVKSFVSPRPTVLTPSLSTSSLTCGDRKSTRLNSSHLVISYAVFCLKKKTTSRHKAHISCHALQKP